jgi:hypothetical protein
MMQKGNWSGQAVEQIAIGLACQIGASLQPNDELMSAHRVMRLCRIHQQGVECGPR